MTHSLVPTLLSVLLASVLLAACSDGDEQGDADASPSASADEFAGTVDVGGHSLHMICVGSGSPTVVYLHGLSHLGQEETDGSSAASLPTLVSETNRFCAYDRANTGSSDELPGPLSARSSAEDLDRLLQGAGIEPPVVLLGASFGGLVAEVYADLFPEQVAGLLLLDAGFPDELDLEHFFPEDERLAHGEHGFSGWADTSENMDELAAYQDAQELAPDTPAVPMTYLLADPPTYDGPTGYLKAFPDELAEFAGRYRPGRVEKVASPHYMEAAIPDQIVTELAALVDNAGG